MNKKAFTRLILFIGALIMFLFAPIESFFESSTLLIAQAKNVESAGGGSTETKKKEEKKAEKKEITKDFDVTTESSMTAESFNKKFANGVFKDQGKFILTEAKKYGINASFMAGIMGHETGWGTSSMAKEILNPGGLSCTGANDKGTGWTCVMRNRYWKKFDSPEAAITEKAAYLQRKYIKEGKKTIITIQKTYCPDGDGCSKWVSGVIGAMTSLGEAGGGSTISAKSVTEDAGKATKEDAVSISPFAKYTVKMNKTAVDTKTNHDSTVIRYLGGDLILTVSKYLMILSRMLGAILFGYMSFLWLFILIARTNFTPAQALVLKMTNGLFDAYDDLGKMIKYTIYGFIFSVVAVSGLIPKVFVLIYKMIMKIIEFVTYSI